MVVAGSISHKTFSGKVPYVQDTGKLSEPAAIGLYIKSQVGRNSNKALLSKASSVCSQNSKTGLGLETGKYTQVSKMK